MYRRKADTLLQSLIQTRQTGEGVGIIFAAAAAAEALARYANQRHHLAWADDPIHTFDSTALVSYRELIADIFQTIPPESPVWSLSQGYRLATMLPDEQRRAYFSGMIWRQQNNDVRQDAYAELLDILRRSGTTADSLRLLALFDSSLTVCGETGCSSSRVIEAAFGFDGAIKWRLERWKDGSIAGRRSYDNLPPDPLAGASMPFLRLRSIDSTRQALTTNDLLDAPYIFIYLRGRIVSYSPLFIDAIFEAQRMYAHRGLHVITLLDVEHPAQLERIGKYKGNRAWIAEDDTAALREFAGASHTDFFFLLVDEHGIIRASDSRLLEEMLFYTLRDFFDE
jgi:hypothetical protein